LSRDQQAKVEKVLSKSAA